MSDYEDARAKAVDAALSEFVRIWRTERHPTGRPVADVSAAIAAYEAHIAAAGWVRVPVEPTREMVQAAAQLDFSAQTDPTWPEYYRAMIAARPGAEVPDA